MQPPNVRREDKIMEKKPSNETRTKLGRNKLVYDSEPDKPQENVKLY